MSADFPASSENVVVVRDLTRRFGSKSALDAVNLVVPRGIVFGLVGENGAGKTTLIRHILGLYRAQSGSVRVFGKDPVKETVAVLSRIGYLAEESELPGWMRVDELLRYTQAFYPSWDQAYAEELRRQFQLDARTKIKSLSKGQRARAGLIAALAYRPDLLVLDEPSSGLDPIVRRDILGAIVRTIAEEGRTVLFSSHLLEEVERVSDRVAMLRQGRVVFAGDLADIKQSHCRVTLRFETPLADPPTLAGVLSWEGSGREWTAVARGNQAELAWAAASIGGELISHQGLSLDEIFLAQTSIPAPTAAGAP